MIFANKRILSLATISFFLLNCSKFNDFKEKDVLNTGEGYRIKTKLTAEEVKQMVVENPKTIVNAGRVILEGSYLFVGEWGLGVHIFDNTDPKIPTPLAFLNIPASTDFFVKDNTLIIDNGNDLVSLTINNLEQLRKKEKTIAELSKSLVLNKRTEKVFVYPNYPIQQNVYFQCPDTTGYFVVAWEKGTFENTSNCYR
jgi:hypothetical protein